MALDIEKVSPTSKHLIVEYQSTESLASAFVPSFKIGKATVARARHLQIMRYVYTLVEVEDVYFEGRRLDHMPGVREYLTEWLTPGRQIVSRPNGRHSVLHSYTGKKNILIGTAMEKDVGALRMPFLDIIGDDPAKGAILYGNPRVPFVTLGDLPPLAAAYYDSRTQRLDIIQSPRRERLLPEFLRRFETASAPVG